MTDPFNPCSASSASVLRTVAWVNYHFKQVIEKISSKTCKCFRCIPADELNKATLLSYRNFYRGNFILGKGFSKFILTDTWVETTNI
jgi:hypothetical protein